MPPRSFEVNGQRWTVSPTGRITQYDKDEFSLRFTRVSPEPREERIVRYSPQGSKSRENSLAEMSDRQLVDLLRVSQPAWTTPEAGYGR
jgi:hypothetical protein